MLQSLPNAVLTELNSLYARTFPLRKLNSKTKFPGKAMPPTGAEFFQSLVLGGNTKRRSCWAWPGTPVFSWTAVKLLAIKHFSGSRLCHGVRNRFSNPTQTALQKNTLPAWDFTGALGGAETGKSTFQSMEHFSSKSTLKSVTDAAQTY